MCKSQVRSFSRLGVDPVHIQKVRLLHIIVIKVLNIIFCFIFSGNLPLEHEKNDTSSIEL